MFYPDASARDDHHGDLQPIDIRVQYTQAAGAWSAELVSVGGTYGSWSAGITRVGPPPAPPAKLPPVPVTEMWDWKVVDATPWETRLGLLLLTHIEARKFEPEDTPLVTLYAAGTHPIIYSSAGKHHFSLRPYELQTYEVVAQFFGIGIPAEVGETRDRANGLGTVVIPAARSKLVLADSTTAVGYHNFGLLVNANEEIVRPQRCARQRAGLPYASFYEAPATFMSGRTLPQLWGYRQTFLDNEPFTGSHPDNDASSIVSSVRSAVTVSPGAIPDGDADGDGKLNREDLCPAIALDLSLASDPSDIDSDGDGVGDACDPSPNAVNRWVGGGILAHRKAYDASKAFAPNPAWGGFLDADGDGRINGADLCPDVADADGPASANENAWAEQRNFEGVGPTTALTRYASTAIDGPYQATKATLGTVFRGDACDPYETAAATLGPQAPIGNSVQTLRCDGMINAAYEGGRVPIDLKVRALAATAVQVEVVKCACVVSGDYATCTNAAGGDCPREGPPRRPLATESATLYWSDVERTGGCARRNDGSCAPLTADAPTAVPVSWDWQAELAREATLPSTVRHLDPAWFEDVISDVEQVDVPYRRAMYPFAFATSVSVPTGVPGTFDVSRHYPPPARGKGQEAAVSPRWNALAPSGDEPDASRRTARMRTTVAPELRVPVTPHPVAVVTPPTTFCHLSFPTDWPGRDRWTLPTLQEIDPYWTPPDPLGAVGGLRDLARGGPLWTLPKGPEGRVTDLRLWLSAREPADPISVDGLDPAAYLLATFDGAPVRAALGDDSTLLPDVIPTGLVARAGWEAGPAMLLSSRSSFAVVARARGTAEGRTRYNTVLRGDLPAALDEGSLVVTAHGIVGYRESRAAGRHLYTLLPGQRDVVEAVFVAPDARANAVSAAVAGPPHVDLIEVPIDQLDLRDDATVAFLRGHIVRAGGTDAGHRVRGDVVRFDARTGNRSALPGTAPEPFPARSRPALVWDADDRGIALGGGVDASGVAHDDVYLLREGDVSARRIVPDSAPATRVPLGPDSALLVLGAERRAVRFGATGDFARENGTSDGWRGEDVARCADGSMPFRCGGSGPFWLEPGAGCAGEACVASPHPTLAGTADVPGKPIIDAALSVGTVWTIRASHLERYDASVAAKLTLQSATHLHGLGTVVLPPEEGVGAGLVGTLKGIAPFQASLGTVQIEAPQELCGRPIDIVAIAPDRFAIATTVGLALATRPAAGLTIDASGLLDHRGFTSVPRTAAGRAACVGAEARAGLRGDHIAPKLGTTIAWTGSAVVVLHGAEIVRVTLSATPTVAARAPVAETSYALRVEGGTVYVAEGAGGTRYDTNTLLPSGTHDVGAWVTRREAGNLRLVQRAAAGPGTAELAWISP